MEQGRGILFNDFNCLTGRIVFYVYAATAIHFTDNLPDYYNTHQLLINDNGIRCNTVKRKKN